MADIRDLKYTLVTTLASADHVKKCIYLCDISVHIMYFVKLCHWRYSVLVTNCIIHLKCAALTAVHTDLCMFCIMSWLLDQQVPFQKKKKRLKFTLEQVMKVQMGIDV